MKPVLMSVPVSPSSSSVAIIVRRSGQCPLRQPRVWLWIAAFALPAHVALAVALSGFMVMQGDDVAACPVTRVMRVALVDAPPAPTPVAPVAAPRHFAAATPRHASPQSAPRAERALRQAAVAPAAPQQDAKRDVAASVAPAARPDEPTFGLERAARFLVPPPPPPYPAASRARGEQGVVRVMARVDGNGPPAGVKLADSSGFQRLDSAALNAVKTWQFADGRGEWVVVPVRFTLTN